MFTTTALSLADARCDPVNLLRAVIRGSVDLPHRLPHLSLLSVPRCKNIRALLAFGRDRCGSAFAGGGKVFVVITSSIYPT